MPVGLFPTDAILKVPVVAPLTNYAPALSRDMTGDAEYIDMNDEEREGRIRMQQYCNPYSDPSMGSEGILVILIEYNELLGHLFHECFREYVQV